MHLTSFTINPFMQYGNSALRFIAKFLNFEIWHPNRHLFLLLCPLLIATGIIISRQWLLPAPLVSNELMLVAAVLLLAIILLIYRLKSSPSGIYYLLLAGCYVLVGLIAWQHSIYQKSQIAVLPMPYFEGDISATIEDIEYHTDALRLLLKITQPSTLASLKVRIHCRTCQIDSLLPGMAIKVRARLLPPPLPKLPQQFDSTEAAFFQEISAYGTALSLPQISPTRSQNSITMLGVIHHIRHLLAQRIIAHSNQPEQGVMLALLLGMKHRLPTELLAQFQQAGLAHLLAISGLHMMLIATGCFLLTERLLLVLCRGNNAIPYHYIASWCAIGMGLCYLLLSSIPVSALRAYIGSLLFFGAILCERSATLMRAVAVAAILILIIDPHALFTASFQLSFAATIALIGCFPYLEPLLPAPTFWQQNPFKKLGRYLLAIILSSLIAGLATAPYALYHFREFSAYGSVSNLIALPLTSLWIMPVGILVLLFAATPLLGFFTHLMALGIAPVIHISEIVASWPDTAAPLLPEISGISLAIFSLGGCLWLFFHRFPSHIGSMLIVGTIFFVYLAQAYNANISRVEFIPIGKQDLAINIITADHLPLVISTASLSSFEQDQLHVDSNEQGWLLLPSRYYYRTPYLYRPDFAQDSPITSISCQRNLCRIALPWLQNDIALWLGKNPPNFCINAAIVMLLRTGLLPPTDMSPICKNATPRYLTASQLHQNGAYTSTENNAFLAIEPIYSYQEIWHKRVQRITDH